MNPVEPAVVTVGSIKGGTKHNIIPEEVKLQLTVRSYSDEVRKLLLDSIRQITVDTCKTFGCPKSPEVKIDEDEYTPAAYNDPALTAAAMGLFADLLGQDQIQPGKFVRQGLTGHQQIEVPRTAGGVGELGRCVGLEQEHAAGPQPSDQCGVEPGTDA